MNDLPAGQITIGDLYKVLVDLQGTMSKLAAHIERIDGRNQAADALHADHEARIRVMEGAIPTNLEGRITGLERMAWKMVGAFGAINAAAVLVEWLIWAKK